MAGNLENRKSQNAVKCRSLVVIIQQPEIAQNIENNRLAIKTLVGKIDIRNLQRIKFIQKRLEAGMRTRPDGKVIESDVFVCPSCRARRSLARRMEGGVGEGHEFSNFINYRIDFLQISPYLQVFQISLFCQI